MGGAQRQPSLLEETGIAEPAANGAPASVPMAAPPPNGDHASAVTSALARARTAEGRRVLKRLGLFTGACAVALGVAWGAIALWPRSIPDYGADPMDQVLDYTLLTDDFNRLPVDKRLGLVRDLIARMKRMSADDSMLMAAFAAQLKDSMRKQLEENAKRLAVDTLDMFAGEYGGVAPDDREAFLDKKILEFFKMMEDLTGEKMGLPEDEAERLAALKKQAQKDQERMAQQRPAVMRGDRVMGFLRFANSDENRVASPLQQARMAGFMRDMVRHLRDQDIQTGLPKGGGGG